MKCSWRNCKEEGHYVHSIKRTNPDFTREITKCFCAYHHRVFKERRGIVDEL
jgi:hypothetical protein